MTEQLKIFAGCVAGGVSAADAANRAGLNLKSCKLARRYYVYALVDPRDGTVFYIGKGKGDRAEQHWGDWLRQGGRNPAKLARIGDIARSGRKPETVCVFDGLSEQTALEIETALIKAIGLRQLTNFNRGNRSVRARAHAEAAEMLKRMRSFCYWRENILPSLLKRDARATEQYLCEMYWKVVAGIHRVWKENTPVSAER